MGCSPSRRVANEDAVRLCRERRRHMRDAVAARNRFAAAHSAYLLSLRRSAAALSRFSSLHSLPVSDKTPPAILSSATPAPPPPPPLPLTFTPPPPPPPLQKARTLPPPRSSMQVSSSDAWNWEEFYPPSPPESEFYDSLSQQRRAVGNVSSSSSPTSSSGGDDRRPLSRENYESELEDRREGEEYEEEDRCSLSTSISTGSVGAEEVRGSERPDKLDRLSTTEIWHRKEGEDGSMVMVLKHRDLKEIAAAIEEYFLKAASDGEAAADLLEAGSARRDGGLRQLKKKLYHSSSVMKTLSSRWSSIPPMAIQYEMGVQQDNDGGKSHRSILDRLFAQEKRLYEEVKAREGAKIEYERKLTALESQEHKGVDSVKLEKTKSSIHRLQSLILATSEAVSSTSSDIIGVRDDELAPQLIDLCDGLLRMWRSMNHCHDSQNHIVQQVCGLVNLSTASGSTDVHRQATQDLESAISNWHSSFVNLMKFQREHIHSLHNWLKLTLHQVGNEIPVKDYYSSLIASELTTFCDEWKQAVDKLPHTVAAEAISSFVTLTHSVYLKQKEELKIKKRVELYSKELEKKTLALQNVEKKYYQSYSMVGLGFPDGGSGGHGQALDAAHPLVEKKKEIAVCRRKVEDELARKARASRATKEMTLNSMQAGLPALFQAMANFSGIFAESLEDVCCRRIDPCRE